MVRIGWFVYKVNHFPRISVKKTKLLKILPAFIDNKTPECFRKTLCNQALLDYMNWLYTIHHYLLDSPCSCKICLHHRFLRA